MAKVVPLKLDPTPFSSKERDRSEDLLVWDKLLRSPTEFLPLRRTIVILTSWNTHQLLLNPAGLENAILPTQCSTFFNPPPDVLNTLRRGERTLSFFLLANRDGQMSPCRSLELKGLLLGC